MTGPFAAAYGRRALSLISIACVGCGELVGQTLVARGGGGGSANTTGGAATSGGVTASGGAPMGGSSGTAQSGGSAGASGADSAPPCPKPALVGFASTSPGTTGGGAGKTVRATSAAELAAYVSADEPLVIELAGRFALSEPLRPKPNKTIIGVAPTAGLTGAGFYVKNSENIVIRNLTISELAAGDRDAIGLDGSHHVWIDHCDLSTSREAARGTYDGLLDITHGSDFITVSWNRLHDHDSVSVIGHSDTNASEDSGHLRVTLHHNYFRNVASDTPRVRFGRAHLFNNYFEDVSQNAAISQMGADVVLERNYFLRVQAPLVTHFTGPQDGNATSLEDLFDQSGDVLIDAPSTWDPSQSYAYRDGWDSAASVPAIVARCAGVGRIE